MRTLDPDYLALNSLESSDNLSYACVSFSLGSIACFVLASLDDNQALDTFLSRVSGMIKTSALKTRNGTTSKSKNGMQLSVRVKHKHY